MNNLLITLKNIYWSVLHNKRLLLVPYLILRDLSTFRFLNTYFKSLKPSSNTLTEELPWLTFKSIHWLNKYLNKNMLVFEFGSGGSTIWLANRTKKVISVEHDTNWFDFVSKKFDEKKINNVTCLLKKPESEIKNTPKLGKYVSNKSMYAGTTFKKYAESILDYDDNLFDLIIVDGRTRVDCIINAIPKIKNGGYLLLDNSERKRYQAGKKVLENFKKIDFTGTGPANTTIWTTTIWKITK